ncbi:MULTISPECIES: sulfurtransferase [Pseudomonas]|uniref:Probable 3-mercaptopyruvate sulfurtransferase n=2 Tax=Pseudomonas viridiflava TaxID=33069 RepID=A0A1Y6JRR4_PSEVI|nr:MULTISPECIES: sulfurtransferase [Pseudomonas]VVM42890.1 Putative thiosulfate sulfurtransferase SseB [Pseudomonas fluorescens]MEE4074029.1 sulfurtransferase [Pseudomonas viridiflava]MEE4131238.1 sulfurtransferase [Pseudomonas viridiflava]PCK92686.1 sulfurtransferase [Pseudomonas viridiflava]WKW33356.1 sulfurtransferase [Pseudomonas viridiflava]
MSIAQLIGPEQLAARQQTPGLVILDCRSALEDPDYGQRSYAQGHIEGARFADLNRDLSSPVVKGRTGRHPLPDADTLVERLRAWGISNDSDIVLYDDGPGMYAARAWWLLAWLGKREGVYLLDGGLKAWHASGLPLSLDAPGGEPGDFTGEPDMSLVLSASRLQGRLGRPEMTLIDARAEARFRGEVEPIDPVAGHIPGAQCVAFNENLGPDGRFLPPEQLKQRFAEKLQGRPAESLVSYCGSGVTACHNLFALCLAGYPLGTLYAGSWSEWIVDPEREVATGAG